MSIRASASACFLASSLLASSLAAPVAVAQAPAPPPAAAKPALPAKAWGKIETVDGKSFQLTKPEIIVGSAADCDVVITEPSVAAHHFKLRFAEGNAVAEELGSKTGTLVAGAELKLGTPKTIGTRVQIDAGTALLQFSFLDRGALIAPTQKVIVRKNANEPAAKSKKPAAQKSARKKSK